VESKPNDFIELENQVIAERRKCRLLGEADALAGRPYNPNQVPLTPSGNPLFFYKEAYDYGFNNPGDYEREFSEFEKVERTLSQMPTRPMEPSDVE
jgi:hypothetical protein